MKTATWTIYIYADENKTDLLFERDYINVDGIIKDFKITKSFLYNCMKPERLDTARKRKIVTRMKHIKIVRVLHLRGGDITSVYSV